jgi:hypothetical protein
MRWSQNILCLQQVVTLLGLATPPPPPLSHNPQGGHSEESLAGLELGSVVKVSGVLTGMVGGAS